MRDSGKQNRLIARRLQAHNERSKELIENGFSEKDADEIAYNEIKSGIIKINSKPTKEWIWKIV